MKNSLMFLAGIAFLIALIMVFTVQVLQPSCFCEGLPGDQCMLCDTEDHTLVQASALSEASVRDPEHLRRFLEAWENEHQLRHHAWVAQHQALHREGLLDDPEGHREYHREMEAAHREFHQAFDARLRVFLEENASE